MYVCPGYLWVANTYQQLKVKDTMGNCTTVRCRKGRRVHKKYLKQMDKAKKKDGR